MKAETSMSVSATDSMLPTAASDIIPDTLCIELLIVIRFFMSRRRYSLAVSIFASKLPVSIWYSVASSPDRVDMSAWKKTIIALIVATEASIEVKETSRDSMSAASRTAIFTMRLVA